MKMKWSKLLSEKRIRDFFEESKSQTSEHRTEFERDYDRAIFCTPVRRLNDKAQVFALEPNDSVRTRLTHSLEVSTVARDIARTIGRWLEKEDQLDEEDVRAIETIAATGGLIHDLGNPPFGHAGELAIAKWFEEKKNKKSFWEFGNYKGSKTQLKKDFIQFDGNAQTLRLVSRLQVLSDLYGLNFTCATMSAMRKYIASSDKIEKGDDKAHERSKAGHFASENLLVDLVDNETGTGHAKNPIAFIVEASDDIVYSVVDIEDGIKKGVINWEEFKDLSKGYSDDDTDILEDCFTKAKRLIDEKDDRVELKGNSRDEAMAQAFRVYAISASVYAVIETFKEKYEDIMNGNYHKELYKDSKTCSLIKACKKVGLKHVYCAKENLQLEVMAKRIIHDLMDTFWQGAQCGKTEGKGFEGKIFSLMSENYRTVFKHGPDKPDVLPKNEPILAKSRGKVELPQKYCCMQLLTDYICGMTDTFACTLHKRLTNG